MMIVSTSCLPGRPISLNRRRLIILLFTFLLVLLSRAVRVVLLLSWDERLTLLFSKVKAQVASFRGAVVVDQGRTFVPTQSTIVPKCDVILMISKLTKT